ncbi:MAG TPA: T9SS type A sorting domain-containing protein, partial [Cyclobacteriaceae bacterium]|nr:T9SS type A sorting domain-containing protein [Cyclobacteriaceae bacterium]
ISGENFFANNQNEVQPLHLSYSVIDLKSDNGLGEMVDTLKNIHVIEDTLVLGRITACKHANGIDWWVIIHRYYSDKYYKLLVTKDGILGPYVQHLGSIITSDVYGQVSFSADGSKFAMISPNNILDYMEFNRCTGEFFNNQIINVPDSTGTRGCSFSPNSRFMYVSSKFNLFQYDTWNVNMAASVIKIAAWDSFVDPIYHIPVYMFMHQLAADGRIYLNTFNGTLYLNVIASPDSLGLACNYLPHSYLLPQYNVGIPSFPNYDLDSLPGSDSCNAIYTMDTKPPNPIGSFRIAPNPVSIWLNIIYNTTEDASFKLFDLYGKKERAISLFHYFKNRLVDVSDLPAGIYLAVITQKGKQVWSEKVVVVH